MGPDFIKLIVDDLDVFDEFEKKFGYNPTQNEFINTSNTINVN